VDVGPAEGTEEEHNEGGEEGGLVVARKTASEWELVRNRPCRCFSHLARRSGEESGGVGYALRVSGFVEDVFVARIAVDVH